MARFPMMKMKPTTPSLQQELLRILAFVSTLKKKSTVEKISYLRDEPAIRDSFESNNALVAWLEDKSSDVIFAILSVFAVGQGHIFLGFESIPDGTEKMDQMVEDLLELENFYGIIGGIIGYQATVLQLLSTKDNKQNSVFTDIHYDKPKGISLSEDTPQLRKIVREGIENLGEMGEIYPDAPLAKVLGSTQSIDMFKMTSKVSKHLKEPEMAGR